MIERIERYSIDIRIPDKPNMGNVQKARWAFIKENGREPNELVLSPHSRHVLLSELEIQYYESHNTYQGLNLKIDPEFEHDEWRIRLVSENIYAVE